MDLKKVQEHWNKLGREDPLTSMLPAHLRGRISDLDQFFASGQNEINSMMAHIDGLKIPLRRKKALDFGCGLGRLTQALASHFDEVYGVEIASSVFELANKYNCYGNKCKYILNQRGDLSIFGDNSFDFICSFGTLYLMQPQYSEGYIRDFLRILMPGGLAVFQIVAEPARTIRGVIFRVIPPALMNLYRRAKYGFEIYGLRRERVIEISESVGAAMLDIREDQTPGKSWVSFQYYVSK